MYIISSHKPTLAFFLTAHFSEEDYPYDWLMLWLSRRPEWQRSREFETTTRTTTPGLGSRAVPDNSFGDEDFDDSSSSRKRERFQWIRRRWRDMLARVCLELSM